MSIKVFKLSEFFFYPVFHQHFGPYSSGTDNPEEEEIDITALSRKIEQLDERTIRTLLQFFKSLFPCGLQRRHKK